MCLLSQAMETVTATQDAWCPLIISLLKIVGVFRAFRGCAATLRRTSTAPRTPRLDLKDSENVRWSTIKSPSDVLHIRDIYATYFPNVARIVLTKSYNLSSMGTISQILGGSVASEEQKRQKFRELAEKRVNRALDSIRLIGNLSNKQTYAYDEAQVKKIVRALRDAVSESEARFSSNSGQGGEFKL